MGPDPNQTANRGLAETFVLLRRAFIAIHSG